MLDFGIVKPEKFTFGENVVLVNRFTGKKIITSRKSIKSIKQRELNLLKRAVVRIEAPSIKKFRLEITLKCNCNCDYCLVYKNKIPQIGSSMSLETAKKIVSRFNTEIPGGSCMIIGGEPLTNSDVLRYFVEQINGNISIFTNATLIDREIAKFLSKPNVKVFVSFDGWKDLNFHRKYDEYRPSFEDSLAGYKNLIEEKVRTAVNCLVTNDNVDYLVEIVKYFYENFNERSFGLSMPHYIKQNSFKVDIKKYTRNMITLFDYIKKRGIYVDQIAKILMVVISENFRYYACKLAGEQITFYPDGSETLCTKLDTLSKFKKKNSNYFRRRLPLHNADCRKCFSLFVCGGGCFWDANFDESGKDRRNCFFHKEMLKKILEDISLNFPKNILLDKEKLEEKYGSLLKK